MIINNVRGKCYICFLNHHFIVLLFETTRMVYMVKTKLFSEEDLREITRAYFSLTTREMIEAEILLIRAGVETTLPIVLDEALASLAYEASVKESIDGKLSFDEKKQNFMNYMLAKSVLDGTIDHTYDVCKRLGGEIEAHLLIYIGSANYHMQLLAACVLYKFEILQKKTIEQIRYIATGKLKSKQDTALYIMLLLILYKADDLQAKTIIKNRAKEINFPEESMLENTYYDVVLNLAGRGF